MSKDIIPYKSKDSKSLVPAKDVETARRNFETPQREITVSETYTYYSGSSGHMPSKAQAMMLIPALEAKLPSLLAKYNTLEAARRKAGVDQGRKQLEAAIDSMLSFGEGLKVLHEAQKTRDPDYHFSKLLRDAWGEGHSGDREIKEEDLFEEGRVHDLSTSLTSEETTWLSVIKRIPDDVFDHRPSSVPAIVEYFCDGLEWALDTLIEKDNTNRARDTFDELGVTGARHDSSFARFTPKFQLALKGLYYAMVADSQIFDRCFEDLSSPALISGDGKILRAMAEEDGKVFSEEYALKNRHRVNEFLSSIVMVSAIKMEAVSGLELVKLIGMLDRMPDIFFKRKKIVFISSGKGLMFLDPVTFEELHYEPFDGYVAHIAQNEIYHSSNAIDRGNPIWDFIFAGVRSRIQKKNASEGNASTLEKVADRMTKKYGIEIELGVKRYVRNRKIMAVVGQVADLGYTVKMGYWDLLCADEILSKIPSPLLGGIKKIKRVAVGSNPYSHMITGVFHAGSYDFKDKILELVIPPLDDDTPEDIIGVSSLSCGFTISHEVGHSVHMTNHNLWKRWLRISRARKNFPIQKRRGEFLTAYASTDKEEDFAESFACYIIMPKEFLALAQVYPTLQKKYEFMKGVFEGKEFEQYLQTNLGNLCGPITFDFTLREKVLKSDDRSLTGPLTEEIRRRIELGEKKARSKPLSGPRVFPVSAIEDPKEAESTPDPREEDQPSGYDHYDMVKVLRELLHKLLGSRSRFVDVEYLELRLDRKDYEMAAIDIANSLGVERVQADLVVQKCRRAMDRMREDDQEVADKLEEAKRKKGPER